MKLQSLLNQEEVILAVAYIERFKPSVQIGQHAGCGGQTVWRNCLIPSVVQPVA